MIQKLLFAAISFVVAGTTLAAEKPNVVIILNDDQGYQDLGCFDSSDIKTPRVDHMAREGMRMTDFYVFKGKAVRSGPWKYHQKEHFQVKQTKREESGLKRSQK